MQPSPSASVPPVTSTEERRAVMPTPETADSQGIHHGSEFETQAAELPVNDLLRGSSLASPQVLVRQALAQVTFRRPTYSPANISRDSMIPQLSPRETLARIREEVDLQNALQQLDEARQSANAATLAALTTERAVLEARHRLSLPVAVYGEPLLSPRPRVLVSPEADTRSPGVHSDRHPRTNRLRPTPTGR